MTINHQINLANYCGGGGYFRPRRFNIAGTSAPVPPRFRRFCHCCMHRPSCNATDVVDSVQ